MQVGFVLPRTDEARTPEAVGRLAAHAEALGYSSLWAIEHEAIPVNQRPPSQVLSVATTTEPIDCPLELLATAAVRTESIRLGPSIPNVGFCSPVSVARSPAGLPVFRAQVQITDAPLGEDRPLFAGSLGQVRRDVIRVAAMGAAEILFDLSLDDSSRQIDTTIAHMTQPAYEPAIV